MSIKTSWYKELFLASSSMLALDSIMCFNSVKSFFYGVR